MAGELTSCGVSQRNRLPKALSKPIWTSILLTLVCGVKHANHNL